MHKQSLLLGIGLLTLGSLVCSVPANSQNALQRSQAKAMREIPPPQAKCWWNESGKPECWYYLNPEHTRQLTLTGADGPQDFIARAQSNFLGHPPSAQELMLVDAIIIKYLSTFDFDAGTSGTCLTKARNTATRTGAAKASNSKYVLDCEYEQGRGSGPYWYYEARVTANRDF
jgi:hypothetical protein